MTLYQNILMWVSLAAAFALAAAGVVVWCDMREVLPGRRILHAFLRLPWLVRLFLVAFVVQLVVHGSTKTNATNGVEGGTANAPMTGLMMGAGMGGPWGHGPYGVASVADADIARGYQMVGVSTNAGYSFAMPSNGVLCGHWHQRGAFDDVTCVDFGDWTFPIGSNEARRLWAFVGGFARPTIRDRVHEIAPVGAPLSAIPSVSRLWMAPTTNDARLVTWENFAIGRIPRAEFETASTNENRFLDAQIELCPNGDFITRSNDLTRTYRRIDPNDWDGDGWHNDDDPDPKDWTGGDFGFEQALPTNANSDAYCWIDVRASYNTPVVFVGDGESNLSDPSFTALAGQTYRVQLLIGKSYAVASDQPLVVVARSSSDIEVDGDGTTELSVVYPVDIYAQEGNGNGFLMRVSPANLGGEFAWTQSCCPITGYGNHYWYAHTGHCTCDGCYAQGHYTYEGYSHDCEGGYCDCPYYCADDPYGTHEDDGPYAGGATVAFSRSVVIFEDSYTNMPGEVVARQSTQTILHCIAHGGDKGGVASFVLSGHNRVISVSGGALPVTMFVPPGQKVDFEIVYEGKVPSASEGDIVATSVFTESESCGGVTSTAVLTSVKACVVALHTAVDNPNENRHIFGVGEESILRFEPSSIVVNVMASCGLLTDVRNGQAEYTAPGEGSSPVITVTCGDAQKEITLDIYEPDGYEVQGIGAAFYDLPNEAGLIDLNFTNRITPQVVSFYAVEVMEIAMVSTNAIGYFAQPEHADDLDHGKRGAYGQWSGVNDDNSTTDLARMGFCAKPWNGGGSYTWPIPNAWRVRGYLFATNVFTHTDQRFELDADGTARVMKFGWMGERGTNNQHRVCEEVDR